jgi:hypothetical protein
LLIRAAVQKNKNQENKTEFEIFHNIVEIKKKCNDSVAFFSPA